MKHARAFHPLDPRGARPRLISAIGLGSLAWFVVPGRMEATTRALLAWDVASFVLLAIGLFIITRADARETRRRAAAYDPGRRVVWILVLAASAFGLFAAAVVIRQGRSPASFEGQLHIALCVATVAISWLLTHSAFTLRYAHLYYRGDGNGGIEFPGKEAPDDLDFAYFGFTIGMTFQVSDAVITDRGIRRTVLRHALLSFMYNTIILALALNLIVGQFG
jgi:uncharacterized membrane protein